MRDLLLFRLWVMAVDLILQFEAICPPVVAPATYTLAAESVVTAFP
jgi:hypothetical protein